MPAAAMPPSTTPPAVTNVVSVHTNPPSCRERAPSARAIANVRRRSARPSQSSRPVAAAISTTREAELDARETLQLDAREAARDQRAVRLDVADRCSRPRLGADALPDGRRRGAGRLHEQRRHGGVVGRLREIAGIDDGVGILGSGRELLRDADVGEADRNRPACARVEHAHRDPVARVQLVVVHDLLAQEDAVRRAARACRARLEAVPPANHESWSLAPRTIGRRIDSVDILEVAPDVGVAVLEGLGRGDARGFRHAVAEARRQPARSARAEHHVCAVREAGIRLGLLLVGGVERRSRRGEARRQGDQRERARDRCCAAATCSRRRCPRARPRRAVSRARSVSGRAEGRARRAGRRAGRRRSRPAAARGTTSSSRTPACCPLRRGRAGPLHRSSRGRRGSRRRSPGGRVRSPPTRDRRCAARRCARAQR